MRAASPPIPTTDRMVVKLHKYPQLSVSVVVIHPMFMTITGGKRSQLYGFSSACTPG